VDRDNGPAHRVHHRRQRRPRFVVAIFITLLLIFNTFPVNMWLQYRRRGRWIDPEFPERIYLILSLVAKSALAWQVYAGALANG
jgi:hypothetical protein